MQAANSNAGVSEMFDLSQPAPEFHPPRERFLELRSQPSALRATTLGVIGAAAFLGLWEVAHYLTPGSAQKFLPSVEQVGLALIALFFEHDFIIDVLVSCRRIFVSFFAAAIIGVPAGMLMGCFSSVRALLNPVLSAWRYLPAASFVPLLLVWFGPTDVAKLALLLIGVVFFLIALVLDNTRAVPREYVEAALTMGATRRETLLGVIMPSALPAIFDSMRNMIAVGWTYLVIAEIVGAQDGIGAVMMRAGRFLNVDTIMAGILTIGILGILTDLVFRFAARVLFPWNVERR